MSWLESYIDQSVTFTSWRKVEAKMCQVLKQNLEKKLMDPVNRQILFQILGDDFVSKYFSSYTGSPAILDNIRTEEKEKKIKEMKTFVSSVIDGTLAPKGPKSDIKIQSDLAAFSQDVQNIIDSDFQEQLSEGKSKRKQKGDLHEKYLSELLSADPDVIESLMPELRSQVVVLSDYLRASIWPACISYKEKPKQKKNSQKIHDRFIQLYIKQHLSQEFSKDSRTISSTVTKIYKETKGLKTLDSENNIFSTVAILSVCDTYGKKFQPYYVFYAAVLQQVFLKSNQRTSDQEFGYAAMMLEKILRLCAVTNERSNKIVNKVIQILTDSDKELVNHIKQHLSSNLDGKTGSSTEKNISSSGSPQAPDLRDSITFYLNKWITDAFSSVLKANCLFLVWDQLFLNKWENKIFQDVCLSLMGLLKPWFMLSKSKRDIEKGDCFPDITGFPDFLLSHMVFLEEPSYLYMLDVRSALSFIQKKVNFSEIPSVNRNIKYGKQEPVKSPSPVQPPPPPPVVPVPARASTPPPKLVPSLPKFIPWVPYNKEKIKDTALVKSKVDMPFDLYIDSVRFVPDYAAVVKVTGKVLNIYLGQKNKSIKFQGIPEMGSYWRHPKFKLKQTVNCESIPMNPDVVVMIRVYTLEQHSKQNYVLGSCLFGPFSNKHGKQATLRVGGHQVRVRHGIPDPDFTVEHMLASHMDDNPIIPGVTVLLRVLPHGKDYAPAPDYETNYYRSELAKPNDSENKLYKHYQDSKDLNAVVRDVALRQSGQASANDETLTQLMWQQLQKEGSDVEDFPYQRFVKYSMEHGIMVLIDKAAGLPLFLEGRYLQCLVQIFPGEDTKIGTGKNQVINFLTEELELDSPQRAPDWSDQPKRVTPEYDGRAFILISLYGLRPKFDTSSEKVLDKGGKDPKFNLQHAVAWGIATCFDKGAVFAGIHHIPLLKGRPPDDIIEKLSYLPLDYICKKFKTEVKVFEAASIEISIWDGHFSSSECPPLPVHTNLLNISSNPKKYLKAAENPTGVTAADLLKQGLSNPSEFNKYRNEIIKQLKTIFKTNLDGSLINSGYKATV